MNRTKKYRPEERPVCRKSMEVLVALLVTSSAYGAPGDQWDLGSDFSAVGNPGPANNATWEYTFERTTLIGPVIDNFPGELPANIGWRTTGESGAISMNRFNQSSADAGKGTNWLAGEVGGHSSKSFGVGARWTTHTGGTFQVDVTGFHARKIEAWLDQELRLTNPKGVEAWPVSWKKNNGSANAVSARRVFTLKPDDVLRLEMKGATWFGMSMHITELSEPTAMPDGDNNGDGLVNTADYIASPQALHWSAPLNLPADVARVRHRLASDPHRPRYHFLPPANFLKDPNGLIFWKGRCHLFYQSNPYEVVDLNMTWSHAVSEDLVHWTDLPVAFAPTPGGPDAAGVFSGGIVLVDGVPTAVYFGNSGGICIARAHPQDELLVHWQKYKTNPIIPTTPEGSPWRPFDPNVFRDGDDWVIICGGRVASGDTAYTLVSKDFRNWKFLHNFYESSRKWTRTIDDCAVPDFFPLGNRYALVFSSHSGQSQYYLGSYNSQEKKFYPEDHGRFSKLRELSLEHGDPQAPMTVLAPDGRRILFNWISEGRRFEVQHKRGWGGVIWLPRVLSLDERGRLLIEPVEELKGLRTNPRKFAPRSIPPGTDLPLKISGTAIELQAEIAPSGSTECGFRVRTSPGGEESTAVVYRPQQQQLVIDISRSSLDADVVDKQEQSAPLTLADGELLQLRIYLDQSVIEVFANGRQCLTKRIYPARRDSDQIRIFAEGGSAELRSLQAWDMKSIWPTK